MFASPCSTFGCILIGTWQRTRKRHEILCSAKDVYAHEPGQCDPVSKESFNTIENRAPRNDDPPVDKKGLSVLLRDELRDPAGWNLLFTYLHGVPNCIVPRAASWISGNFREIDTFFLFAVFARICCFCVDIRCVISIMVRV